MRKSGSREYAFCPDCERRIGFDHTPYLEEVVYCPNCEAALMVVELHPIELEWAYVDDEADYEDYEDFDEDDDDDEDNNEEDED
jgi:hypothetical protein